MGILRTVLLKGSLGEGEGGERGREWREAMVVTSNGFGDFD